MLADNYSGILQQLASQGFVVVAPQMYEAGGAPFGKPSSEEEATLALSVYDWVKNSLVSELSVTVDIDAMGLVGHSRGGKVAWAALMQETGSAVAIAGIDPVDGSEGITSFDSKLLTGPLPFSMPSLVIGAGLGGQQGVGGFAPACAPEGQNHVQFFSAVQGPAWHVTIPGCGHLDMLNDEGCGLQCLACPSGNNKAVMRKAIGGLLTAFFRATLAGNDADFAFLEDANTAITPMSFESK
jgi:chlorophyllase